MHQITAHIRMQFVQLADLFFAKKQCLQVGQATETRKRFQFGRQRDAHVDWLLLIIIIGQIHTIAHQK